jgi:septal ring factor EnvC (AmiA/AmiB activator)
VFPLLEQIQTEHAYVYSLLEQIQTKHAFVFPFLEQIQTEHAFVFSLLEQIQTEHESAKRQLAEFAKEVEALSLNLRKSEDEREALERALQESELRSGEQGQQFEQLEAARNAELAIWAAEKEDFVVGECLVCPEDNVMPNAHPNPAQPQIIQNKLMPRTNTDMNMIPYIC